MRENKAFLVAHTALFAVVLIGFSRTFYFNRWFGQPPNDAALVLHGAVLTTWFALTALQAGLATSGRRGSHRALAVPAALVSLGVVATGTWINTRLALQVQSPASPLNMFIWANYLTLGAYAMLLGFGVSFRGHPAFHRRLVLISSIAIVGPAFARLAFWPLLGGSGVAGGPLFAVAGMLLTLLALAGYDRLAIGRIHKATWWGVAIIVLSIGIGTAVALSGLGFEAINQIRRFT